MGRRFLQEAGESRAERGANTPGVLRHGDARGIHSVWDLQWAEVRSQRGSTFVFRVVFSMPTIVRSSPYLIENTPMILVTGASGTNGIHLIRELKGMGVKPRTILRDPSRGDVLRALGAEVVAGDLSKPETLSEALRDVTDLFLLSPGDERQVHFELDALAAAKFAGVRRVVKFSAVGADPFARGHFSRSHGIVEAALRESGLAWVILRPNFFTTNLLNSAESIKQHNTMYGHWGVGRSAWVDPRDIAAVAATVLMDRGHEGHIYEISGPQALSNSEVCHAFGRVLGRTIEYVDLSDEQYEQGAIKAGLPAWLARGVTRLKDCVVSKDASQVSDVVRRIARKEPISVEQFIVENARAFGG